MKMLLFVAALLGAVTLAPTRATAQGNPASAVGPTQARSQLGMSASSDAVALPSAATLMQDGGRRHSPGYSLIIVGAIGMLAGLVFRNGELLLIGSAVTAVGLVIYLF